MLTYLQKCKKRGSFQGNCQSFLADLQATANAAAAPSNESSTSFRPGLPPAECVLSKDIKIKILKFGKRCHRESQTEGQLEGHIVAH